MNAKDDTLEMQFWDRQVVEAERAAMAVEGDEIACDRAQEAVVMAKVNRSEAMADYLATAGVDEKVRVRSTAPSRDEEADRGMSNVYSLADALEDSATLTDLAKKAGVTVDQARRLLADLSNRPAQQVVRLLYGAHRHEVATRRRGR